MFQMKIHAVVYRAENFQAKTVKVQHEQDHDVGSRCLAG